ncbi:phospholipid transfer protein C2CD2L [Paramormyrops kingsleyae]|uniref:C2cd2 like n=1 Tax=Paramormyrops kingsleyae TaxID=1676925 RepID=A0A3B3QZ03_9TELE|nr:phospholipid transfer protein C2CD2L-like [Paramormyrops kingsleyae]XP_023672064.1 phospholipid transfer protein C2CD2L-like [Paramormyrops kingsleyae]XP_023672065.1 phospholipid transfer protein C2CD2L-like [Paramormyrops kingsleyae]
MLLQDISWMILVTLFLTSLLIVITWLIQYSRTVLRARSSKPAGQKLRESPSWDQIKVGGIWGSLQKLRFGQDVGGGDSGAAEKGLLSSLFSFRTFRENWQRAWVRALNEQACRHGSSIQITFNDSLPLATSASISHVTCTDQSARSMVLQCNCSVDTVTFPVTVTQQSPAAVSMDTYQITIAPMQVQMEVCLEEVEEEGLLVSWHFSRRPLLSLTVSPRKIQREGNDNEPDVSMIRDLVEDTLFSTQPAMTVNLKTCVSSSPVSGEKLIRGPSSPPRGSPGRRLVVRQLRVTSVRRVSQVSGAELCCALDLHPPALEKRTRYLPYPSSLLAGLDWTEDVTLDPGPETKELRVRLVERSGKGEQFLPGHASLSLDPSQRNLIGRHMLSVSSEHGLLPTGTVSFELLFQEQADSRGGVISMPPRPSVTPTKKVEMDRTVMPDGTIVTTVTTIQSRPKLDRKLGESPSRSPSKVEVTEKKPSTLPEGYQDTISPTTSTDSHLSNGLDPVAEAAIRQLTESAGKPVKKTPTKRSTLIISGVSKVPLGEDESALSVGYAAAMDAALQGEHSPGSVNHHQNAGSHGPTQQDTDETTPSDVSERPSVDDVESETGSTGALETRSLKDHKVGFLRSGTKLLFRRRHRQKDPGLSQSHEDISNLGNGGTVRKKSGSFSRRLIKRFSFRSKSKGKASANGDASTSEN